LTSVVQSWFDGSTLRIRKQFASRFTCEIISQLRNIRQLVVLIGLEQLTNHSKIPSTLRHCSLHSTEPNRKILSIKFWIVGIQLADNFIQITHCRLLKKEFQRSNSKVLIIVRRNKLSEVVEIFHGVDFWWSESGSNRNNFGAQNCENWCAYWLLAGQ